MHREIVNHTVLSIEFNDVTIFSNSDCFIHCNHFRRFLLEIVILQIQDGEITIMIEMTMLIEKGTGMSIQRLGLLVIAIIAATLRNQTHGYTA